MIDLDSYNKTRVNGEFISPNERFRLKLNDVIIFGTQCLIVTTSDKVSTNADIQRFSEQHRTSRSIGPIVFDKSELSKVDEEMLEDDEDFLEQEEEQDDQDQYNTDNIIPIVGTIAEFGDQSDQQKNESFYHYGDDKSKYNTLAQMLKELGEHRRRLTDLESKINSFYNDLDEAKKLSKNLKKIQEKKDELRKHLEGISPEPESFYRMETPSFKKKPKASKRQKQYDSILSLYDELNEHRQEYKSCETKLKLIDVEETKDRIKYAKDAFLQTRKKFEQAQSTYDRLLRESKKKKKVEQINKKSELKEQLARLQQQLQDMEDDSE